MENLYIILLLIIIGYFALYFGGRKYLETFNGQEKFLDSEPDIQDPSELNKDMQYPSELNKDTYELSQIYNNQGSKTASKKQISDAMTRYPLDWSVQGPNSQIFQENQAKYENDSKKRVDSEPYINQHSDIILPDAST